MTLTLALSKTGSTVVSTIKETDEGAKTPQAVEKTPRERDLEKTIEADTDEQNLPEHQGCDGGKETEQDKETGMKKRTQWDVCERDNFKTLSGLANHKRLTHKSSNSERDLKKIKSKTIDKSCRPSMTLPIDAVFNCEIWCLIHMF